MGSAVCNLHEVFGSQRELFLESEYAAVLYVDDVVDGAGRVISRGGLTRLDCSVILDTLGSVSASEERRGEVGFTREDRKVVISEPKAPDPQGSSDA